MNMYRLVSTSLRAEYSYVLFNNYNKEIVFLIINQLCKYQKTNC